MLRMSLSYGQRQVLMVMAGRFRESFFPERDITEISLRNRCQGDHSRLHRAPTQLRACSGFCNVAAIVHFDDAEIFERTCLAESVAGLAPKRERLGVQAAACSISPCASANAPAPSMARARTEGGTLAPCACAIARRRRSRPSYDGPCATRTARALLPAARAHSRHGRSQGYRGRPEVVVLLRQEVEPVDLIGSRQSLPCLFPDRGTCVRVVRRWCPALRTEATFAGVLADRLQHSHPGSLPPPRRWPPGSVSPATRRHRASRRLTARPDRRWHRRPRLLRVQAPSAKMLRRAKRVCAGGSRRS